VDREGKSSINLARCLLLSPSAFTLPLASRTSYIVKMGITESKVAGPSPHERAVNRAIEYERRRVEAMQLDNEQQRETRYDEKGYVLVEADSGGP